MARVRGAIAVLLAVALPAATVRAQTAPPAPMPAPVAPPAPYGGPPPAYPPGYVPWTGNPEPYGAPTGMQLMMYEDQKKSAPLALVLELFLLPGLGSVYAGHPQGALITWAGLGGGIVLVIAGASRLEHTEYNANGPVHTGNDDQAGAFIVAGIIALAAGRIYGLVDSWQSSNDYNASLAKRLGLPPLAATVAPIPTERGLAWGPALQLRF